MRVVRVVGVAGAGLAAILLAGCSALGGNPTSGGANRGGQPATVVNAAKAVTGPISEVATYTGNVQPGNTVNVAPQISGRIVKLNVDVGSQVKAGDVLAQLDTSTLSAQVAQAQAGVDAAQVKLQQIQAGARPEAADAAQANAQGAEAKLQAVQAGARPETVAEAKANLDAAKAKLAVIQQGARPENVGQAKANLDAAIAKLKALLDGPTPDQVAAANLQVEQAKDALAASQANKDGQCNPRNPSYLCEAAQAQAFSATTALAVAQQNLKTLTDPPTQDAINQAQAAVDAAQQAYDLAKNPYTAQDLAQAQAAVDAAQQAYNLAKAPYTAQDLAQAQAAATAAEDQAKLAAAPYTDLDVKAAQAAVEQAQAALAIAKAQMQQAIITAPFDGVITAKMLSVGALASPSTPIFTIMSPDLQVQFSIDESRIGNVKTGQTVSLTTTAFPGKTFPAQVTSVYPSADPKTHTFTVVVQPKDTTGSLRAGMFVSLQVTIASFPNAVLVPNAALVQRGPQSIVFVANNGRAQLVPVTTGIADDNNTQIVNGITAGEDVVTSGQANLNDGSAIRVVGNPASGGSAARPAGGSGARPTGAAAGRSGSATRATATP